MSFVDLPDGARLHFEITGEEPVVTPVASGSGSVQMILSVKDPDSAFDQAIGSTPAKSHPSPKPMAGEPAG